MYVTTVHDHFTLEYTLAAMLAGTYSVRVAELHGATEFFPKA